MDTYKHVFVLRHGERSDRVHPRYVRPYEVPFDPSLTELGLLQAERSAQFIQHISPKNVSVHIVSSPFLRCLETAGKLAHVFNAPIHIEEGFGEFLCDFDFGANPFDSLWYKSYDLESLSEHLNGAKVIVNSHVLRPTFPETHTTLAPRVRQAFDAYFPKLDSEVIIFVTHLFILENLTSIFLSKEIEMSEQGYCKLTYAQYRNGEWEVKLEGEYLHAPQYISHK
jgi:broad specificity phosphatase PhoE